MGVLLYGFVMFVQVLLETWLNRGIMFLSNLEVSESFFSGRAYMWVTLDLE